MTSKLECPQRFELVEITKEDRDAIISIFADDEIYVSDNDHDDDYAYFITKLDDDVDDVFYDHSVPFAKIFQKLGGVCCGFEFNNDYYKKTDVNTYYGIWFKKLVPIAERGNGNQA